MLQNDFYHIVRQSGEEGTVHATVSYHAGHKIFKGHFPGLPVVPGVCMMQTVRELMENFAGSKMKIVSGDNLKFLAIINPEQHNEVDIDIQYNRSGNDYLLNATLSSGTTTFFKFKGTLQLV
jgi:3-hydroxyacyl-[acyl-carrier-protein] dehydratase